MFNIWRAIPITFHKSSSKDDEHIFIIVKGQMYWIIQKWVCLILKDEGSSEIVQQEHFLGDFL